MESEKTLSPSDTDDDLDLDSYSAFNPSCSSPTPHRINLLDHCLNNEMIDMNNLGDIIKGNKACTSGDSDGEEDDDQNIAYYSFLNRKSNKDRFHDGQFVIEPRDKRILRAKAVATQEKELIRALSLNAQRRDARVTVGSISKIDDTEGFNTNNDLISSFNTSIELREDEEYDDSTVNNYDSRDSRSPSPLQRVASPKVVTDNIIEADNNEVLKEVGKVHEVDSNKKNVPTVDSIKKKKKQKSKSSNKVESPLSTVPELSELSLLLNNLIGSGMLDTLYTIQDRLRTIDTLSTEMVNCNTYIQAVNTVNKRAIETSALVNNIDYNLCDGSITTASISKSQWEKYGKKAYTAEGSEMVNLLLEKNSLLCKSRMLNDSPKQQHKIENNGSIIYSLKSLPYKAISVATTYMKCAVSPKKKKPSVHPDTNPRIQLSKTKVYPYDIGDSETRVNGNTLSPTENCEGVILMEYMDKLTMLEADDESVDADFLNSVTHNDAINGVTDIDLVENCMDADIRDSLHSLQNDIGGAILHVENADSIITQNMNSSTNTLESPSLVEQDEALAVHRVDEIIDDMIDDDIV